MIKWAIIFAVIGVIAGVLGLLASRHLRKDWAE